MKSRNWEKSKNGILHRKQSRKAYYAKNKKYEAKRNKKWRVENKKHLQAYRRKYQERKSPAWHLFRSAKYRANKSGLPFNLELRDIILPKRCPVLRTVLDYSTKKRTVKPNSPSIDRVIPALGYVKGNVNVISHRANTIKQNASVEEIQKVAEYCRRCL